MAGNYGFLPLQSFGLVRHEKQTNKQNNNSKNKQTKNYCLTANAMEKTQIISSKKPNIFCQVSGNKADPGRGTNEKAKALGSVSCQREIVNGLSILSSSLLTESFFDISQVRYLQPCENILKGNFI